MCLIGDSPLRMRQISRSQSSFPVSLLTVTEEPGAARLEFLQKVVMKLDGHELNSKIQQLKI